MMRHRVGAHCDDVAGEEQVQRWRAAAGRRRLRELYEDFQVIRRRASRADDQLRRSPMTMTRISGALVVLLLASVVPAPTYAQAVAAAPAPQLTVEQMKDFLKRSEEHTSELSHSQISYAVFCLKKKKTKSIALPDATI